MNDTQNKVLEYCLRSYRRHEALAALIDVSFFDADATNDNSRNELDHWLYSNPLRLCEPGIARARRELLPAPAAPAVTHVEATIEFDVFGVHDKYDGTIAQRLSQAIEGLVVVNPEDQVSFYGQVGHVRVTAIERKSV